MTITVSEMIGIESTDDTNNALGGGMIACEELFAI